MATEGKIPMMGFKALAIKFVTLFGFDIGDASVPTPVPIPMTGSLTPIVMTGSLLGANTGSLTTIAMSGSEGD